MNYEKLRSHQTVLLDLYTSLNETLNKEGNAIDLGLKTIQENIKAEKFLLAIVGEVKAGKSTFINAMLREAMLPFDTLQATSEIVEIHQSNKKEVQVTFANGTTQVVEDDPKTPENEAVPFLKKIASVNEEYRDIPIVQVNKFLIDHYSEEEGKAVFEESDLKNFVFDSELENIHNLEEEKFEREIREYINKNISCDEIPQRVILGYPHTFSEFRHFRIVDTPGINAIGGIENQTKEFIKQADAVIYLHKAGQQESKALRNALENELPERVKDRLILVLTYRSQYFCPGENEHERILKQTEKLYPAIGSGNIFFVDSLTELHLKGLYEKSMDEIKATRRKDPQLRSLTADCVDVADGNKYALLDLLEAQANFRDIRERIEKDAQNSASLQIKDFANAMQEEYGVLDNRIGANIDLLRRKYKHPQSFASAIEKQEQEMESMKSDYSEFISELESEFSAKYRNSKYHKRIEQIRTNFTNEIEKKEFDSNEHNEKTVQSYVETLEENYKDEIARFVNALKVDFEKRIKDKNVEVQNEYSITVPEISVRSIWGKSLEATKTEIREQLDQVEESKGFWYGFGNVILPGIPYLIKENEKYNIQKSLPQKYWSRMKGDIASSITRGGTRFQEEINAMINKFCGEYNYKFEGELKERKQYMAQLKKNKKTNEELEEDISTMEAEKKRIENNIKMCIKIKGEL